MTKNSFSFTKKLYMVCALVLCLALMVVPVVADSFDPNHSGSLTMTLRTSDGRVSAVGAEIAIYKVGDCHYEKGALSYLPTDDFAMSGIDFYKINQKDMAAKIAAFATKNKLTAIKQKTDANGTVKFKDLSLGLYLVTQTSPVSNVSSIEPFFIAVGTIDENGNAIYDVNATPKIEIVALHSISVQKVWNDDGKNRPKQIKAALLRNGAVYSEIVLSEKNNWSFTWNDLAGIDGWSVQEVDVPAGYKATYKQNGTHFIIENTPKLAQTGQHRWPIPMMLCIGMVLILSGVMVRTKDEDK